MLGIPSLVFANKFAERICGSELADGWQCVTVKPGQSWNRLIADPDYRLVVQKYNRQNMWLFAGQKVIFPPRGISWMGLAQMPNRIQTTDNDLFVFDPVQLAWAHYLNGKLVRWGPAVGGKSWCPDLERSCQTTVGTFHFSETAKRGRRSETFPVGCKTDEDVECAPIPYFIRFTERGQGIHQRSMRGSNASHGCVGVFMDDVLYISNHVRWRVGKGGYGYLTPDQRERSRQSIVFQVLPYDEVQKVARLSD